MSNWVENRIELVGAPKAIQLFRRSYDGIGCCGRTLCVHRLAERLIPPGPDRDWASGICIEDEDEFDADLNAYNLFVAGESLIPLFAMVSREIPDIRFSVRSCDISADCGYSYHAFEASFKWGLASNMLHDYWTITEKSEDSEHIVKEIGELDRLFFAMKDPYKTIYLAEPEPCPVDPEF